MSEGADDIDVANERAQLSLDANIAEVRNRAAAMPVGNPGDCELCGAWTARLVLGVCAPCRDKYKL